MHVSIPWCSLSIKEERGTRNLISVFDALLQLLPCFSILISQTKPSQIGLMEITRAFRKIESRIKKNNDQSEAEVKNDY